MTLDDETTKQIQTGAATASVVAILGWIWLWVLRITGLPRRVDRLEHVGQASARLLLAIADSSLARAPKDKAEAREALRKARDSMYGSLTDTPEEKKK